MSSDQAAGFFRSVYEEGDADFDALRFLTEVEAQFKSEDVVHEVRWRLEALTQISSQPGMESASATLRDKLTQVFTAGGNEAAVLDRLKALTEIEGKDGARLDLRSFLKRDRRVLSEQDYRAVLGRKIANTNAHVINLIAYYPQAEPDLHKLGAALRGLTTKIKDGSVNTSSLRRMEDKVREMPSFGLYEDLKSRFLKDWLGRFSQLSEEQLKGLTPAEIQRMIQEHQRHQLTQLLKGRIKPIDLDMTDYLGLHDTLEAGFNDTEFWRSANAASKAAFIKWVMDVVRAFGMLKGLRHAFFQSEDHPEQYLLFGLGLSHLPEASEDAIRMVPYIKPFTRKGTYLLEIRRRDIGDSDAYYHELRHYTLPFLFAFDKMKEFEIRQELVSFFTTGY
ncbi:MAG TPA: hypothetical protein VKB51_18475 [bacterium]|nr:hypothetical protein [bacterium]